MNWDLILTVFMLALIFAIFLPIYLIAYAAYQKTKFESMIEVMSKTEMKLKDHDFDIALKNMYEEGVGND